MTTNVVQISVIVTMSKLIDLKTLLIVPRCIFLVCKNTRIIDVMVQAYVKPTPIQNYAILNVPTTLVSFRSQYAIS